MNELVEKIKLEMIEQILGSCSWTLEEAINYARPILGQEIINELIEKDKIK